MRSSSSCYYQGNNLVKFHYHITLSGDTEELTGKALHPNRDGAGSADTASPGPFHAFVPDPAIILHSSED